MYTTATCSHIPPFIKHTDLLEFYGNPQTEGFKKLKNQTSNLDQSNYMQRLLYYSGFARFYEVFKYVNEACGLIIISKLTPGANEMIEKLLNFVLKAVLQWHRTPRRLIVD